MLESEFETKDVYRYNSRTLNVDPHSHDAILEYDCKYVLPCRLLFLTLLLERVVLVVRAVNLEET
jgi:hypothetical protein